MVEIAGHTAAESWWEQKRPGPATHRGGGTTGRIAPREKAGSGGCPNSRCPLSSPETNGNVSPLDMLWNQMRIPSATCLLFAAMRAWVTISSSSSVLQWREGETREMLGSTEADLKEALDW